MFEVDDPQLAAVAWSRITEPGDEVAGALVQNLGACEALRWLTQHDGADAAGFGAAGFDAAGAGVAGVGGAGAEGSGAEVASVDSVVGFAGTPSKARQKLLTAAQGWKTRLPGLDPAKDIQNGQRVGAQLILPTDPRWPAQFAALGAAAPFCLWVLGNADVAKYANRSVALVGARAATHYGEQIAVQMAAGLVDREFAVVSGGAYGIDAAAHRGALTSGGFTVAFLAGGIDRPYPPGNTALLRAIAESGAVISEVPPGCTPYRNRFLARNRLIAALAGATVVVEAAWRSGALSTARHAANLLRPVGAVPGPVTSMASGGCHQLIRSGEAVLVTDAGEVAELAGTMALDSAPLPAARREPTDGLTADQKRVYDILPMQRFVALSALIRTAGLPFPDVLAALGVLEIRGLAQSKNDGWRRANS